MAPIWETTVDELANNTVVMQLFHNKSSRHMDETMCLSTSLAQSSTVLAEGSILIRHFCESEIDSGASVNTVENRS